MQLTYINTRELIPYAKNSRTHSAEQVAQIAASIEEFGFTNPVLVDSKSGIIAGHGRVMAAQKLKLATIPCIILDRLTETQKRAYVIADNKLAMNAGWDHAMLSAELVELREIDFNLDLIGFDGDEIESILNPAEPEQPEPSEQEGEEKEPIECPHCRKFFIP
jgi:ParB-like chromosome segregation protein Spo0J